MFICEFDRRTQIAKLQVFDELVIARESAGRTREFGGVVPVKQLADGAPFVAASDDSTTHSQQRWRLGVPQTRSSEASPGLEMKIEARRVDVFAAMRKSHRNVRFVGTLVGREARVAINAEQRPASRARIRYQVGRDVIQGRREICDEPHGRLPGNGFVLLLVGLEPLAVIVAFQTREKTKELGSKVRGHGNLRYEECLAK